MKQFYPGMDSDKNANGILPLIIEGKKYDWHEQYITGAEVKKLAGLPLDSELYLSIPDPWKDEKVSNDDRIDLARPEIEHFYVKKKLQYTINSAKFESDRQYVKGSFLRKQGNVPDNEEIFLKVEKPWVDELIKDDEFVDLARPGTEHFYSKPKEVTIVVNGTPHKWDKIKISFKDVIILAFGQYIDKPTMVYTVAYEDGPKENPEGSMFVGQEVFVKNKMVFHATATDKS